MSWSNIRALAGSRQAGFEEICAQLARSETPDGAKFVRKGSPDAGVECFCVLEDGSEWGWQAKFFTSSPSPSQWGQLDASVRKALDKHPNLVRYFVCMPKDRADSRRERQQSMLDRWNERVAKWERWAADSRRSVEFCWWGSSELIERLSTEDHAGRVSFWFGDHTRFTNQWFKKRLDEAVYTAGERYTPEVHVDLPIARSLDMFGRAASSVDSIRARRNAVRQQFQALRPYPTDSDDTVGAFGLEELRSVGDKVLAGFDGLEFEPDQTIELYSIVADLKHAVDSADDSIHSLWDQEHECNQDRTPDDSAGYKRNPFEEWRSRLWVFQREISEIRAPLEEADKYVNRELMILEGAAGTGKTHLLCDFARRRVDAGLPTVLLMGQRFGTSDDPWRQALDHLDLSDLRAERFVGALEAAAQVADARALVIVDALNERRGVDIWPDHLPTFVSRLRRSPWIAVLLSVRSTYTNKLVPDHVRQDAVVVEHRGFQGNEYDAIEIYCDYYGLEFPSIPILHPEFSNPLFLKTICRGLRDTGKRRLPTGFQGISALFDLYLDAVNRRVAGCIDYDEADNLVQQALSKIATRMLETERREVPRRDAKVIVDGILPLRTYSRSLFAELISEGVLLQDVSQPNSDPSGEFVYFTYERFADHIIANHLLTTCLDPQNPPAAFAEGGGIAFVGTHYRWLGLVEALSVQLPEQYGLELPTVAPGLINDPTTGEAFLQSIIWRDVNAFSDHTVAVLHDLLNRAIHHSQLYDTLAVVATVPNHPFNAEFLGQSLRQLTMPTRDEHWSTYLHYAYGEQGPVDRLLDWATSRNVSGRDAIEDQVSHLSAIVLGWMLTASNRFVRDRATKGLVSLLSGRLDAARTLLERFRDVDDPYVCERIYAVAYGVAMRSHDPASVGRLASLVYESVFATGEPPPHILLRDYARGVIERAIHLGSVVAADPELFQPPYQSEWPHSPDDNEFQALTPHFDDGTVAWSGPEWSRNRIRSSVMNDDFARYIIGTNSGITDWLSLTLDIDQWLSPTERMEASQASLSDEAIAALAELQTVERQVPMRLAFVADGDDLTNTMLLGSSAGGMEPTEDDYRRARSQAEKARQHFLTTLNSTQAQEYESIRSARADGDPRFDLKIIQRYVLWRIFDLGWTVDRFGEFDLAVGKWRWGKAKNAERIGKKYQWIAYHEILAHISDHYQYRSWYATDENDPRYRGPWQIHRRDIDPSWTLRSLPWTSSQDDANHAWWLPNYSNWKEPRDHRQWLDDLDDFRDLDRLLRAARGSDGSQWVNLRSTPIWSEPIPPDNGFYNVESRDVWVLATAYFVDAEKVDDFLTWSNSVDFWNRWMPEPPHGDALYVREHGWGPAFTDSHGFKLDFTIPPDDVTCPTPVQVAAFGYNTSGGEYDCSVDDAQTVYLPHPSVIGAMGLKWSGHGADFVDDGGRLAAFDPTAYEPGPSALLIREDVLTDYLDRKGLGLVWAMTGQKRIINARERYDAPSWTGSCRYTSQGLKGQIRRRTSTL